MNFDVDELGDDDSSFSRFFQAIYLPVFLAFSAACFGGFQHFYGLVPLANMARIQFSDVLHGPFALSDSRPDQHMTHAFMNRYYMELPVELRLEILRTKRYLEYIDRACHICDKCGVVALGVYDCNDCGVIMCWACSGRESRRSSFPLCDACGAFICGNCEDFCKICGELACGDCIAYEPDHFLDNVCRGCMERDWDSEPHRQHTHCGKCAWFMNLAAHGLLPHADAEDDEYSDQTDDDVDSEMEDE